MLRRSFLPSNMVNYDEECFLGWVERKTDDLMTSVKECTSLEQRSPTECLVCRLQAVLSPK